MGGLVNEDRTPLSAAWTTYVSYAVLIVFGHIRDFFGRVFRVEGHVEKPGYAPLLASFDNFYTRRLYTRIRDCWNRPIDSAAGRQVSLKMRRSPDYNISFEFTGESRVCLNLGSYNYLGFGDPFGPCTEQVTASILKDGVSACSARADVGTTRSHLELENMVAEFIGKEAALVFGMGFGTNSWSLPALLSRGTLVLSDALNHASIVAGCRASEAKIQVFKHNDPDSLEAALRKAIAYGQPRTHRPWKKIVIIVEGIYSMEGEVCRLPEIVALKKKYKAYLYVDEAHSIGALGHSGRGVCDQTNVNPADVDILMGTFTKSFGSVGGYICGDQTLIDYLRTKAIGATYCTSMSPPCAEQVISSMGIIMGRGGTGEGKRRIMQLKDNANYFRERLLEMGFVVFGDEDSPVIPLMLYHPCKIPAFSRECLKEGLAVVVVGYPATPLILSRARFCLSAAHTREDMDFALKGISAVGDRMALKYLAPRTIPAFVSDSKWASMLFVATAAATYVFSDLITGLLPAMG